MKKGFTLVELLAVIVILAVILAIAIPGISSVINNASESALESDAKLIIKGIEYKKLEDSGFNPNSVNESNVKSLLNIDDTNYQSLTVKEINGVIYVTIVGKNKWDKLTVSGTKARTSVNDTVTTLSYGANAPALVTGMTPIKWNGSAWVDTTESDTDWYNYTTTDKKWANARTADGSMWVWIPRYIYKIPTANWHTSTAGTIDIQFSKGVDDNWNKTVIGNINLDQTANASNNTWTNHPAFTFGDTELTGTWVAKFEASGTTSAIDSKPNVSSLRGQTVDTIYTTARNMETNSRYGWGATGSGIDTHMMKNAEWGTVVYLSRSVYGKNDEIWMNNSSTFTTGCAGSSAAPSEFNGCENTYETTNGVQASTTGNIYGIYDISGGSSEYVAAYVDNGHTNLTTYGNSAYIADDKYRDMYTKASTDSDANNYALSISHKGDAIYEISASGAGSTSWNGARSSMIRTDAPWFIRGGNYHWWSDAGDFNFDYSSGDTDNWYGFRNGFRPVLAVNAGL